MPETISADFLRIYTNGIEEIHQRIVAVEHPIAVEINGLGYAVMMMTPQDLVDFAYGFALSERLIEAAPDIVDVDVHHADAGVIIRIQIVADRADLVLDRVRHRISESSCGLCGIDNLEHAVRPLPIMPPNTTPEPSAIFAALNAMREMQILNKSTGAVHGAAYCGADGTIRLIREDVGRHTSFDKLIGAMLRSDTTWGAGFALLSSRCSYELVEKAVLAGCPTLVTLSAPTSLALSRAHDTGLNLITLARPDSYLVSA